MLCFWPHVFQVIIVTVKLPYSSLFSPTSVVLPHEFKHRAQSQARGNVLWTLTSFPAQNKKRCTSGQSHQNSKNLALSGVYYTEKTEHAA